MKFKKLMGTMLGITSVTLVATASLTACATNIDEKQKITLDKEGKYSKNVKAEDVIKAALTDTSSQNAMKTSIANEIIFDWYKDRADNGNVTFQSNMKKYEKDSKKAYNDKIQSYKDQYGKEWEFYFNNEVLTACNGSKDEWIHQDIISKMKTDFSTNVFAMNYLGYNEDTSVTPSTDPRYAKASDNISKKIYENQDNWKNFGWYATVDNNYSLDSVQEDATAIAKNMSADYAYIQKQIFDIWFDDVNPYVSTATLYKYSAPVDYKMSDIYNINGTGIEEKIATPSLQFPYFGGATSSGSKSSTYKFWDFMNALTGSGKSSTSVYNTDYGYLDIPGSASLTDDVSEEGGAASTLILCTGESSFNELVTPYASASADLYLQMMDNNSSNKNNLSSATYFDQLLKATPNELAKDNNFILNLFTANSSGEMNADSSVNTTNAPSNINLDNIYANVADQISDPDAFFSKLFADIKTVSDANATLKNSKYILNSFNINIDTYKDKTTKSSQPFTFELNEFGMHGQTIDNYHFIHSKTSEADKKEAQKEALLFRAFQTKKSQGSGKNSIDIQSKMKEYFDANIDTIILKIALDDITNSNQKSVFSSLSSYANNSYSKNDSFIYQVLIDKKQGFIDQAGPNSADNFITYLNLVNQYQDMNNDIKVKATINDKMLNNEAAKALISNSGYEKDTKEMYQNGLSAPSAYSFTSASDGNISNYTVSNVITNKTNNDLNNLKTELDNAIISLSISTSVNETNPFSPQVQAATKIQANQYWYYSPIINKGVKAYASNADTANLANMQKIATFNEYLEGQGNGLTGAVNDAINQKYFQSKLISFDKPTIYYDQSINSYDKYVKGLPGIYDSFMLNDKLNNGEYSAETLAKVVFDVTVRYLLTWDADQSLYTYENFYKALEKKIATDEVGYIGYVNKSRETTQANSTQTILSRFGWKDNINNMKDQYGYNGQTPTIGVNTNLSFDQYWNVGIDSASNKLMGFTGFQTKSSNNLDAAVSTALFDKFMKSTNNSNYYSDDSSNMTQKTSELGNLYKYACNNQYTFQSTDVDIQLIDSNLSVNSFDRSTYKLVDKIIKDFSSMQDLRDFAITLDSNLLTPIFLDAIDKTKDPSVDNYKKTLLNLITANSNLVKIDHAFNRVTNIQLHKEDSTSYLLGDDVSLIGYNGIFSQINYEDVHTHQLTGDNKIITDSQLGFIIADLALDATNQTTAINAIIRELYGKDKIEVFNVDIYNQLGSSWIKDWSTKI